jgi:hypothetical protein
MPWVSAKSSGAIPELEKVPAPAADLQVKTLEQDPAPTAEITQLEPVVKPEKTEAQKREERIRRESCDGRFLPRCDVYDRPKTQREYDASLVTARSRILQWEDEARNKRGGHPVVRGCKTCDPSRRVHGPDCVGECERHWR